MEQVIQRNQGQQNRTGMQTMPTLMDYSNPVGSVGNRFTEQINTNIDDGLTDEEREEVNIMMSYGGGSRINQGMLTTLMITVEGLKNELDKRN